MSSKYTKKLGNRAEVGGVDAFLFAPECCVVHVYWVEPIYNLLV